MVGSNGGGHGVGFNTTATIMYGHIEQYHHIAKHLLRIRDLQAKTSGFTELLFCPLFIWRLLYLKGKARKGPTFGKQCSSTLSLDWCYITYSGIYDALDEAEP